MCYLFLNFPPLLWDLVLKEREAVPYGWDAATRAAKH